MNKRFNQCLVAGLLLSTTLTAAHADNNHRLKKINRQIAAIKQNLGKATVDLNQQQNQLAKVESHLSSLDEQLQNNRQQLKTTHSQLSKLQQQNTTYKQQLDQQQSLLAEQIVSSYHLGEQPLVKMLLGQQNPEHLQRMLMYYKYFNQQRIKTIEQWKSTIAKLEDNLVDIEQHQLQLKALEQKQAAEKQQYRQSYRQRQRVIRQLNRQISSKQKRLHNLLVNKRSLEKAIRQAQTQRLKPYSGKTSFGRLKGKLIWPTKGRITQPYGSAIDGSELKTDGVLITAPSGQDVRAIADGQVIFSKWLAGYGLLLIIKHSSGYMTLYGRNQNLYKRVGDKVNKGEVIATVGKTGGYNKSGLYFAIRHNAKPLNPSRWCHRA